MRDKYSKKWTIDLRIVTITLQTGEKEVLLTNLPQEIMTIEDLEYIYNKRWGIETNYNTLKNIDFTWKITVVKKDKALSKMYIQNSSYSTYSIT